MIDRRDFLKAGALVAAGGFVRQNHAAQTAAKIKRITIENRMPPGMKATLAERDLVRGLASLGIARNISLAGEPTRGDVSNSSSASIHIRLLVTPANFKGNEEYEIADQDNAIVLRGASDQAVLYAIFDFLERQGTVFGIDGETAPIELPISLTTPRADRPWIAAPCFAVRGLLPWPDFLNCISVYNEEDFQAYFANMLRMRFNMFGMHVYTQNPPLAESYLSFDFAGAGHRAALEDTTMTSWGYLPQRTSTYKMGAAQFFDRETFGADATRLAADIWEIAARTTKMLRAGLDYASALGIRTGIGFEPYNNPAEIVRALPPEAKSYPGGFIESNTARDLLERRLADLLERYPNVDYVWLWQDEGSNWESRKRNIPLSVTPFQQAHDFLRRHAPQKRLVLAGWGGVTRNFQSLHQRLPGDIVFSALNDTVGWDPVNEAFGRLEGRERWPIPWLEDDPSMWFPQFRAGRFEMDMKRAQDFGCQGMLGIHWRHRIVDPTATYFARAGWDKTLTAAGHYKSFCAAQAQGDRIGRLADLFVACDQGRKISSTFLGKYDGNGYAQTIENTGDYNEAFYYGSHEPNLAVLPAQREIAEQFAKLKEAAASPLEKDRIGYFSGFVGLMVPYCDAYEAAHKLGAVLNAAVDLRARKNEAGAREKVLHEGVPLWLEMAPLVRETMLDFENTVATRNDQGQLASMQNKFVRISLERLRLSLEEFLGEPPERMVAAYNAAISSESSATRRVFIPTRPSILKAGESLRLFIVAPGSGSGAGSGPVDEVNLYTRTRANRQWTSQSATLVGRSVYEAKLGPFQVGDVVEYYASASFQNSDRRYVAPPESPANVYSLTLIEGGNMPRGMS